MHQVSHIEGIYVPSLYDVTYQTDGTIAYTGGTQNFTLTNVEENAKTTAIQTVRLSADDTEAVFDLNGRQLPKDALCKKGVYIIRSQQSTRKVIIR